VFCEVWLGRTARFKLWRSTDARRWLWAQTKEKRKVGRPIAWVGDPNSPDLTPQVRSPCCSVTLGSQLMRCMRVTRRCVCMQERRRIKRRIANRESARRVRARRQDMLEEMIEKVCTARCLGTQLLPVLCLLRGLAVCPAPGCNVGALAVSGWAARVLGCWQAKDMEAANLEMQRHARECDEQCCALEAQAAEFHDRWRATAADNARLQAELDRLREMIAVSAPAPLLGPNCQQRGRSVGVSRSLLPSSLLALMLAYLLVRCGSTFAAALGSTSAEGHQQSGCAVRPDAVHCELEHCCANCAEPPGAARRESGSGGARACLGCTRAELSAAGHSAAS